MSGYVRNLPFTLPSQESAEGQALQKQWEDQRLQEPPIAIAGLGPLGPASGEIGAFEIGDSSPPKR
jgi:hypothetical protein